jgi:hypothetical protein
MMATWIFSEDKDWKEFKDGVKELGIKLSEYKKFKGVEGAVYVCAKDADETNECFTYNDILVSLINNVINLKEENEKLKTKLQEQSGWLASKELQQHLEARVRFLENKTKARGK